MAYKIHRDKKGKVVKFTDIITGEEVDAALVDKTGIEGWEDEE